MKKDTATNVLTKVHADLNSEVPFDLVENIYEVEKQFLFEKDRDRPLDLIRAAVEEYISKKEPS